jgi:hypothetical protein
VAASVVEFDVEDGMSQRKTDVERWVESASEQLRRRPKGPDSWMIERQVAIIAEVVKLHRESQRATRH